MNELKFTVASAVSVPLEEWNKLVELRAAAVDRMKVEDAIDLAVEYKDRESFNREIEKLGDTHDRLVTAIRAVMTEKPT